MSQGRYSSEEEALVGLARQLADAFEEAQTEEDREYAADAIDDFLSDHDHYAPTEALIALLDLPLTKQTWPLVDSVESTLIERGTEVVEELLDASRGHVYDLDGPVPQRALETLHGLSDIKLVRGLLRILSGSADDELKQAAVDQFVAVGEAAVAPLEQALYDEAARPWAEDALGDIRAAREEDQVVEEPGGHDVA
jgi:GAF domain-containing protein